MPADDALLRQTLKALEEAQDALYEGHPVRVVYTQKAIAALRERIGEGRGMSMANATDRRRQSSH